MAGRRREVCFEEMFPWEIAAAMAEAPLCYLPLGTLEWHGEHAAGGETSLLLAIRPDLVSLDKTLETDRSLRPYYAKEPAHLRGRKETPHEYIGVNPGVPDSSNDPEEATIERGRVLLEAIVDRVATRARALCLPTDEHTVNRVA